MRKGLIGGLALVLALAACGRSPTEMAPAVAPRMDGGHTYGGGLVVPEPEPESTGTYDTGTCDGGDEGGHTYGGGLFAPPSCPDPEPAS
jgi:uncharacterized membrane protein